MSNMDGAGIPSHLLPCLKGLCLARATRVAHYRADGDKLVPMNSCDSHGLPPSVDLPQADEARAWNLANAHWL